MLRKITVLDEDNGKPLRGVIEFYHPRETLVAKEKLSGRGTCQVDIGAEWIDRVKLDKEEVRTDWDIEKKENLELWVKNPKKIKKQYSDEVTGDGLAMQFAYRDGAPLARADVKIYRSGEIIGEGKTNDQGKVRIDPDKNWADRIEVDGTIVAEDVELAGGGLFGNRTLEFEAQRPEEMGSESREEGLGFFNVERSPMRVIRGRIYLPNGRVADTVSRVEVMTDQGTFAANEVRDGWFAVALPAGDGTDRLLGQSANKPQIFIDGNEPKSAYWDRNAQSWTLIHDSSSFFPFMEDKGSKGGLLTGRAVNYKGQPLPDAKISADLGSNIWDMVFERSLGDSDWFRSVFMQSSSEPIAKTNKNGFFSLHLPYGECAKKLFVDGDEPTKIVSGESIIPNKDIKPGNFNLELWASRRIFRDMIG